MAMLFIPIDSLSYFNFFVFIHSTLLFMYHKQFNNILSSTFVINLCHKFVQRQMPLNKFVTLDVRDKHCLYEYQNYNPDH